MTTIRVDIVRIALYDPYSSEAEDKGGKVGCVVLV